MEQLSLREQKMVLDRSRGWTYEALGGIYGMSTQRAHVLVQKATEQVNRLELQLMVARKTGEAVGLLVPHQDQNDRKVALAYYYWVRDRLRDRGVQVQVDHRTTTEGEVFFLTDTTDYSPGANEQ